MNTEVIAQVKLHVQRIAEIREAKMLAKAQDRLERRRDLNRIRMREYHAKNKEVINAKRCERYRLQSHEKEIAYSRAYWAKHKDKYNAIAKERYALLSEEKKAKSIARLEAWNKAHPEKERERKRRWREKQKQLRLMQKEQSQ